MILSLDSTEWQIGRTQGHLAQPSEDLLEASFHFIENALPTLWGALVDSHENFAAAFCRRFF